MDKKVKRENDLKKEGSYDNMKSENSDWDRNVVSSMYDAKTEEEEEEKYFCAVCEHTSYSMEAYQEHVVSQEHVSRAARVFHLDIPTKKQLKEESKDKEIHHCEICDINCNGEICWTAHLSGSKHKKKEKLRHIEEEVIKAAQGNTKVKIEETEPLQSTTSEMFSYPEPLIGLEYIVEIHITGEALRYECEICECKFDGNMKYAHVIGVKHRYAVLKIKDPEWARQSSSSCDKRSDFTIKMGQVAKELEEKEGRQKIRARREIITYPDLKLDGRESISPENQPKVIPKMYRDNPSPTNEEIEAEERERDAKLTQPYFQQDFDERPERASSKERYHRSPSRERKHERSPKRYTPPPRGRSRSPHRSRSPRRRSPPPRERSSHSHRSGSPPFSRFPAGRSESPPRDIGDEIQEEMRRQKRRQEEERRREERRKRHAKREEMERREAEEKRRREQDRHRSQEQPSGEQRTIDEDTRRLVMQNLTELAKCCVTNEADAELALQVSNALTQALLQYRMRNMPASQQVQQPLPHIPQPGPPPPNNQNFSPFQPPPPHPGPPFNNSPMTPQNLSPFPPQTTMNLPNQNTPTGNAPIPPAVNISGAGINNRPMFSGDQPQQMQHQPPQQSMAHFNSNNPQPPFSPPFQQQNTPQNQQQNNPPRPIQPQQHQNIAMPPHNVSQHQHQQQQQPQQQQIVVNAPNMAGPNRNMLPPPTSMQNQQQQHQHQQPMNSQQPHGHRQQHVQPNQQQIHQSPQQGHPQQPPQQPQQPPHQQNMMFHNNQQPQQQQGQPQQQQQPQPQHLNLQRPPPPQPPPQPPNNMQQQMPNQQQQQQRQIMNDLQMQNQIRGLLQQQQQQQQQQHHHNQQQHPSQQPQHPAQQQHQLQQHNQQRPPHHIQPPPSQQNNQMDRQFNQMR